jgi:uncharacterized OB-fold protein
VADKPLPVADADSQPFWDACREQRLIAQRCDECGRFRWPPRGVCPSCSSWSFTWRQLPLTGTVERYVVPHRAFNPAFADDVPYVVVHVIMDTTAGRVVLVSNLVGCDWRDVKVGMPVEASFDEHGLPKFRPR